MKLFYNCNAATMVDGQYGAIHHAAIVIEGTRIKWIGQRDALPPLAITEKQDLDRAWVTPGLIDCHTHIVFGGDRSGEFEQRLTGTSYAEIAQQGGGILGSVRATRSATEDELFDAALKRAQVLLKEGITLLEIKSGYGLDLDSELKMLRVIRRLKQTLPVDIRATCLAAHAVPPEYRGRSDNYIKLVCDEILPAVKEHQLADAVDAFCESIAFSPAQVEQVFTRAQALGLPVKLHAEQLSVLHGGELAARYQALSADHLEYLTRQDASAMAAAGTVAVLLPGATLTLRERQMPPVALLREFAVPIALATDCNPGTSPSLSLRLMLNLGCTLFSMTPEEVLAAVTVNAAKALGADQDHGTLAPGKLANLAIWDIAQPAELAYWVGGQLPCHTIYHGEERR